MAIKELRPIYQIKIILTGIKPPIWRRVKVHSSIRLDVLHQVIQSSMGWLGYHLHQFEKDGVFYGVLNDDFEIDFTPEVNDERNYKLSDILKSEKDSMGYDYDFGDDWQHKIIVEKILPFEPSAEFAICIKGVRACPPEDCGGEWGYQNLLDAISNPSHSEYEEKLEWLGIPFDPKEFNLSETNKLLAEIKP